MPEQVWYIAVGFFLLGHLGFVIRILLSFVGSGQKKLSLIDDYVADNGAVFLLGLLSYWAIAALWFWTDAIGFLGGFGESIGLIPGELNAWAIVIAILADALLKFLVDKLGDKVGVDKITDKIASAVPKLGKDNEPTSPTA
jgi:hypothetical protein